jgi:hypothetical protein
LNKVKASLGILLLVVAGLACGLSSATTNDGPRSTLLGTPTAAVVPPAAREDPRNFLLDALSDQLLSTPIRITIQEVLPRKTVNYTVEYQPPDRFHVIVAGAVEAIMIGPQMTVIKGSWEKAPLTNVLLYAGAIGQAGGDVSTAISDVKFVRVEFLDKKPLLVFTFTGKAQIGKYESTSANTLWIWAFSIHAYKLESVTISGDIRSTTTALFDYDPKIKIESPRR